MVKKRKRTVLSIKDKVDILKLTVTTSIAIVVANDCSDSSWPGLSLYHSNGKMIVSIALFLLHSKSFADKWRPNGFEHMMASNNALEWVHVCLSTRHSSCHGYEHCDCVEWPRPSIIHLTEHFAYPNEFLAAAGYRGSDNWGYTVLQKQVLNTHPQFQESNKL